MNIKDKGRFFIFKTILFNNRLNTYKKYINFAKQNGYIVCSMQDFYKDKDSENKHFILRHDVDYLSKATRKMFEVECSLGVKSTYYFRHCTIDEKLIKDMLAAGFEVGLHYETLSDYAEEKNITSKNNIDFSVVREILKKEIAEFKEKYNPNMVSIASHGAERNRILKCSNNVIIEFDNNIEKAYSDLGIQFESYDKNIYEHYIDYHIMDGNIRINNGFSYENTTPVNGVLENKKNIVFLAHPTHWYFNFKEWLLNLASCILNRMNFSSNRHFVRIAGLE